MQSKNTVIITDPAHPFFNQEVSGDCAYYDVYHRGPSGPDLFLIETSEGKACILSTQIDQDHYWSQRRRQEIEKLGANVGDRVKITNPHSGGSKVVFDWDEPHIITKIDPYGNVEWDDGAAWGFRPDMIVIERAAIQV